MSKANQYPTNPNQRKGWKRVAAAAALAGAATAAVFGMKAYNESQAAERASNNATIEKTIQPTLNDMGNKILDTYNKDPEHSKVVMTKNADGRFEFNTKTSDEGMQSETDVVMDAGKDQNPDPNHTVFAGVSNNFENGSVMGSGQLATHEGADYVQTADQNYQKGDAFADDFASVGKDIATHGQASLRTTATVDETWTTPQDPFHTLEGTAAKAAEDAAQTFEDNMKF